LLLYLSFRLFGPAAEPEEPLDKGVAVITGNNVEKIVKVRACPLCVWCVMAVGHSC
jgi:hypothetical protein